MEKKFSATRLDGKNVTLMITPPIALTGFTLPTQPIAYLAPPQTTSWFPALIITPVFMTLLV